MGSPSRLPPTPPRRGRSLFRGSLAVGSLSLLGCLDAHAPGAGEVDAVAASLAAVSQDPHPTQESVAAVVPGFGGYFLDASGVPTVFLTDPGQRPAAEAALAGFLADRGFAAADIRVRHGDYEYLELAQWYRLARPAAFTVAGIILGDVDEGRNRLRFGVANAAAELSVVAAVTGLGVPAAAIVVERRSPVVAMNTLRDRNRPLVGGLQINFFPTPAGTPGVSLICTLGFNAERFGIPGFITNSHCSNVEGGEETPTEYYQSSRSGGEDDFIGVEVDDPHWTSQLNLDCPPPLACRYSDAARAEYGADVPVRLGRIARVDEVTTTLDDTLHTIAGEWRIRSKRADPVQGEVAHKTGRTTGWTSGQTTGTCVDVLALGTTHIRLCQAIVSALVDGGDSGSPVFFRRGGPNVTLLGVLWGGSVDEENPEFVYSPMSGVERELGALEVF